MDAVAMGGEAYRFRMAAQGGNVGKPEDWRVELDHLGARPGNRIFDVLWGGHLPREGWNVSLPG